MVVLVVHVVLMILLVNVLSHVVLQLHVLLALIVIQMVSVQDAQYYSVQLFFVQLILHENKLSTKMDVPFAHAVLTIRLANVPVKPLPQVLLVHKLLPQKHAPVVL
jgi:hypothetical protein